MTSSTSPSKGSEGRRSLGRTRLVTAASIVLVVVAGAAAVSANVGILDTASDSSVGNASAAGDLADPSSRVLDVYLPDEVPDDDRPSEQTYEVDVAGKVTVVSDDDGLRLGRVDPEDGWRWTLDQPDPTHLVVVMTNGVRTFELHAAQNRDGTITARVTEPIVGGDRGSSTTAAASPSDTVATTPLGTGASGSVDDHGGDRDDAIDRIEDEIDRREDEAEDRAKEREDHEEEGRDDDD